LATRKRAPSRTTTPARSRRRTSSGLASQFTPDVVRSIIGIARDLGKAVVAEGVESVEQVRALEAWGCPTIQGYVYARPLPAGAATNLLARDSPLEATDTSTAA
jgi:EAL domain-containing protein (putative c-di-GMP-specific phosphodiesterase class I)